MMKKFIAGMVVLIVLGGLSAYVYADRNQIVEKIDEFPINSMASQKTKIDEQSFRVVTPEKDIVTSDYNLFVSFTAPEGTKVTIEVYYNASIVANRENYILAYDPIKFEVGALQRGWAEIELKKGINKIQFTAVDREDTKRVETRVVTVKDIDEVKKMVEDIVNTPTTKVLENIVNTSTGTTP